MKYNLPNDVCRCEPLAHGCDKKQTCLRYTDRPMCDYVPYADLSCDGECVYFIDGVGIELGEE